MLAGEVTVTYLLSLLLIIFFLVILVFSFVLPLLTVGGVYVR